MLKISGEMLLCLEFGIMIKYILNTLRREQGQGNINFPRYNGGDGELESG